MVPTEDRKVSSMMRQWLPKSWRRSLARWRQQLSSARREQQAAAESAERRLRESFAELQAMVGRGDIARVTIAADEAELELRDGRRFGFDPYDRLEHLYSLPVSGEFEHKETEWLRRHLQPGEHCVDAGGSFGWYAVLFARGVKANGQVKVFEPIPRTAAVLRANLHRNQVEGHTSVAEVALAARTGTADLFVPDIGVSGSLRLHDHKETYETFHCPLQRLDDLGQDWTRWDWLKADVEGAEFDLLKGAEELVVRFQPTMMLEVQAESTRKFGYEPEELFVWLQDRAYVGGWVSPEGKLVRFDGQGAYPDYNFIFVPQSKCTQFEWAEGADK